MFSLYRALFSQFVGSEYFENVMMLLSELIEHFESFGVEATSRSRRHSGKPACDTVLYRIVIISFSTILCFGLFRLK